MAPRSYLARQVAHWTRAASRLQRLEDLASQASWAALEQYLGVAIRRCLSEAVNRLEQQGAELRSRLRDAARPEDLPAIRRGLAAFRAQYVRVETTLDFYSDAINTRSSPRMAALLRACDALAYRSLASALDPLGLQAPLVLTYIDMGIGACILKAGLRLWDRNTVSPVAAIKCVRHGLWRPTSLIHETGHQFAHTVGWNQELATAMQAVISGRSPQLAAVWAGWTSEISADTFAFAHTGYASVAGLHDVLAGDERAVFRYLPTDPHPVSYIRLLLGVEMCRQFYGPGPWDDLAAGWTEAYPLSNAPAGVQKLLGESIALLPAVVELCLRTPMRAFGGRTLAELVNPDRVRPENLLRMERQLGPALFTSLHWVWTESLRLLALTGYKEALMGEETLEPDRDAEGWMFRLGNSLRAA